MVVGVGCCWWRDVGRDVGRDVRSYRGWGRLAFSQMVGDEGEATTYVAGGEDLVTDWGLLLGW